MDAKQALRQDVRFAIKALPEDVKASASQRVCRDLLPAFVGAPGVLAYWPMKHEVDLAVLYRQLLDQNVPLYFPRTYKEGRMSFYGVANLPTDDREGGGELGWELGPHNIWCPAEDNACLLGQISHILVPGIAFAPSSSQSWKRLGQGGGYYDRFLARPEIVKAKRWSVAFSVQVVEELPCDPWDLSVDRLWVADTSC